MKKYLFIVLMFFFWSCEEDDISTVNKDHVGIWEVFYQGTTFSNYTGNDLVEDSKVETNGYVCYINPAPTIELKADGNFVLKWFCPVEIDDCRRDLAQGNFYGAYPGNRIDQNNDSLFGGFDIDGNESPGNYYNINGELESCDPNRDEFEDVENTGELHPCNGTWHSDENNIYLKYDYSGQTYSYELFEENNKLKMKIDFIDYRSGIISHENNTGKRVIMVKNL